MKNWLTVLLALLFLQAQRTQSQNKLFVQAEIEKAINKNTRTHDGIPGENYWQNHTDYEIEVSLDAKQKLVTGSETVVYFNNSPETLNQLVVRLYQNLYQQAAARKMMIAESDVHQGMQISNLKVNQKEIDLHSNAANIDGTNLIISLKQGLAPQTSIELSLDWQFKLPSQGFRQGAKNDSTFFIGYWYPQIAVYDDLFGWDTQQYKGIPEFYNDFNNFDVKITVPDGYLVWATGNLENAEEVYSTEVMNKLKSVHQVDSVVDIIGAADLPSSNLVLGNQWHFSAENVPDFAFASSNHCIWSAVSADIDSDKKVMVHSVYPPQNSQAFASVIGHAKKSLEFFSQTDPGIPYPYPTHITFNGWSSVAFPGGMEFPMMANNYEFNMPFAAVVTSHEIFHNYFPFYCGINERKYTWMDEGWADFYDDKYLSLVNEYASSQVKGFTTTMWARNTSGTTTDMPIMTTSQVLVEDVYSSHSTKASIAYRILENILGEELLRQGVQEFVNRWQGKHPSPYDFFNTLEDIADMDLKWFWQPWFFDFGYPDVEIVGVDEKNIVIRKVGHLPIPVIIEITYDDDSTETIEESALIWSENNEKVKIAFDAEKTPSKVTLENRFFPDKYQDNNIWNQP